MQFACLIFQNEKTPPSMSDEAWQAVFQEYESLTNSLRKSGRLFGTYALEATTETVTVRVRGGKATSADGPTSETKEQLSGIYMIEAEDHEAAFRVAENIPSARWGSIEVRPLKDYAADRKDVVAGASTDSKV